MPSKRATATIGPDGICSECQQRHVTRRGGPACLGHVRFERDPESPNYRARLDQPKPCGGSPRKGLDRCGSHGAGSTKVAEVGRQRVAQAKAEAIMRRFGEPIDTTPSEALLDTVKWTAGYVAWLRDKVAGITSDEKLIWGQTRRKLGGHDTGTTHEAKPNAWLTLLGDWQDRLVRVCSEAIKAGIEERKVRLAEAQGEIVAQVMRAILDDLHLTVEQQALVSEVVPRHLRAIAG